MEVATTQFNSIASRWTAVKRATWIVVAGCMFAASGFAANQIPLDPIDYRHDLAHALQKTDSPRDWALSAQLLETQPPSGALLRERLAILGKAAGAARDDRLVQSLWADIGLEGFCKRRTACGNPGALARLEPDNAAAWLPVVDNAIRGGNQRAINAAIARMSSASHFNEHFGQAIAAWRDVFRRYPPSSIAMNRSAGSAGVEAALLDRIGLEATESASLPATSLIDACSKVRHPDAGAARLRNCGRIGRVMMNRAQTLLARIDGVRILRVSHEGTAADVARVRTVAWQDEQMRTIFDAVDKDVVAKQNYLNLIETNDSEIAALQYELTLFGIALTPPANWKQKVNGKPIEPLDDPLAQLR